MSSALEQARSQLVRRWGEMGGYWGINRTMAEIHALLFVTREPLCTDDIMEQLKISRGNASMNLRALVDWGLIERVHKLGDRKEYFRADTDVWHMFETIMRERRRREVEPIIDTIDHCCQQVHAAEYPPDHPEAEDAQVFLKRLEDLRHFLATMGTLFELVLEFGGAGIEQLSRTLLSAAEKKAPAAGRRPARGQNRKRSSE